MLKKLIPWLACLGLSHSLWASESQIVEKTTQVPVPDVSAYDYLLYLPKDYAEQTDKQWPLVLFLHGKGNVGDDLHALEGYGPLGYTMMGDELPFISVSPLLRPKYHEKTWSAEALHYLLADISQHYRIDPKRIHVTGLSLGAFGSTGLALAFPKRFASITPIAGGDYNYASVWQFNQAPQNAIPIDKTSYCRINQSSVWLAHGLLDSMVPARLSQEVVETLSQCAGSSPISISVYPQVGHSVWDYLYEDPSFWHWITLQTQSEPHSELFPTPTDLSVYSGDYQQGDLQLTLLVKNQALYVQYLDENAQPIVQRLLAIAPDAFIGQLGILQFKRQSQQVHSVMVGRSGEFKRH